jgi:small-conductance mechanosensitive channel
VYELQYWIADYAEDEDLEEEVRTRIWYAAARAGLEFPFPIRTLVLPAPRNHDGRGRIQATQLSTLQEET